MIVLKQTGRVVEYGEAVNGDTRLQRTISDENRGVLNIIHAIAWNIDHAARRAPGARSTVFVANSIMPEI